MNHPGDDARRQAWTSYWASGDLHSCVGSFRGNYGGAIGAFWAGVFEPVQPTERVLDLATGNGALPLLLWERHGGEACPEIDAVDLAQLAPAWYLPEQHPRIRFHAGVAMEHLPFADGRFDLVVSQFGFEYARRPDSLRECLRVAAPRARLAFVMHHAGSVLVQVGRSELGHQRRLRAPDGLLAAATRVVPWIARARSGLEMRGQAEAWACREAYNAALAGLAREIGQAAAPDLLVEARDWVQRLVAAVGTDPAPPLEAIARYADALDAAALRTDELIAHALDAAQVGDIADYFRAARPDAEVRCQPLHQAEGLLGWALQVLPVGSAAA